MSSPDRERENGGPARRPGMLRGVTAPALPKRLLLLRHANAESTLGVVDHERALTERGRRDAAAVGAWLVMAGIDCDLVICSTALRTRQTWDAAAGAGARAAEIDYHSAIYHGGPTGVLGVIGQDAGDLETVLVVGHAPTMPMLAEALTAGRGNAQAHADLAAGFPTAALAVLRYAGRWPDLGQGTAELEAFAIGRG